MTLSEPVIPPDKKHAADRGESLSLVEPLRIAADSRFRQELHDIASARTKSQFFVAGQRFLRMVIDKYLDNNSRYLSCWISDTKSAILDALHHLRLPAVQGITPLFSVSFPAPLTIRAPAGGA